ncbi:non-functional pseudokinase ZED1-like isoform X2 [Quercus lobata]|uniref:non-functional pseudokinase ZED1-like isoform X2 n=1 Tax=Quercus lobata TaxID=97700 RepID=UPI001245C709|nr:non-functional pseudokinase ZED1-like isoform X2 [Quercus lobata]
MRRSWLTDHFFNKTRKEREKAFLENGGKLLEKLIASCNGKPIPIRTFSAQQLRQATNNYCEHLGKYWYKGSLEGKIVLVNRFSGSGAHLTINDIVISAQMSAHSNVLKPIGCCLETTPLILVYEFAANGFLADQIYVKRVTELQYQPMVWEKRLKIARQISHAISYLHTAFPRPVIHMFMHMRDILLDEHDVPKLSNFIYSISIPEGETDVKGFWGIQNVRFCPPESKASGSCINEIVDPAIMAIGEGGASLPRQLQAVLDLAITCTENDPQRRPNMVDVTKELRRIERFTQADEELLGSLRNSKLHERFEEHASTSLKRNLSNDESHAVL